MVLATTKPLNRAQNEPNLGAFRFLTIPDQIPVLTEPEKSFGPLTILAVKCDKFKFEFFFLKLYFWLFSIKGLAVKCGGSIF